MRIGALARPRIVEDVGLVRALVDRRHAAFGEAHRLALGRPGGRRGLLNPARPVVMRVTPPIADVLRPEHPGLAVSAVGDGRARLRRARGVRGIEPVERLAALDLAAQISRIVDRARRAQRVVGMIRAVPPVGERRIEIDADEIDSRVRPQRIEMKMEAAAPVRRIVAAPLGPVGGIRDLRPRPQNAPHLGGQRLQPRDARIGAGARAHRRDPAQLAGDEKRIHPARRDGERRIVADHPRQPPFAVEERGHRIRRRAALVRTARTPRRGVTGDAAAPGERPLLRPAPRIGQAVARRHVHQDEGIERHLHAARLQRGDRGDHRGIIRRAAIVRTSLGGAHHIGRAARHARDLPSDGPGALLGDLDAGADAARPGAKIVAEPGDDQRHPLHAGQRRLQLVQRGLEVASAGAVVDVLGDPRPAPGVAQHAPRRQRELARPGDQADRLDRLLQRPGLARRRPHDLERKLRHAVAERLQRQILEHRIGGAAKGGRVRALQRLDQRIGGLILRARMNAHDDAIEGQRLAIRPDPADTADYSLAQPNREARGIGVFCHARPALAAAVTLARLLEARRPDHLSGQPHRPEDARDRRARRRGLDLQFLQARTFDAGAAAQQRIDLRPGIGADRPADRRAGDRLAEQRDPRRQQGVARRLSGEAENQCRHEGIPI